MKNIQKVHVGEDYTRYSYRENGVTKEVEITGIAQEIINTLGMALKKQSFVEYLDGFSIKTSKH